MNVYSKKFWQQVKKQYKPNKSVVGFYICSTSNRFESAWNIETSYKNIIFLFDRFKEEKSYKLLKSSKTALIPIMSSIDYESHIKIRLEFMDWCIENLND